MAEGANPNNPPTDPGESAPPKPSNRFASAGEASKEVLDGFNAWSSTVATYGRQMAYAVIAADWLIYVGKGSADDLFKNACGKWSMIICLLYLVLNLFIAWLLSLKYMKQVDASEDATGWAESFTKYSSNSRENPWPYTHTINNLGIFFRFINWFGPTVGGILLVVGMLIG